MIVIDCKTPQYGTFRLAILPRLLRSSAAFGAVHCRLVWDTIYISLSMAQQQRVGNLAFGRPMNECAELLTGMNGLAKLTNK